jgi:tyrosinase
MTSIAKLNARRKTAGLPLIRFAVRNLQPEDVQDLRDAFAAMYEISDTAVGDNRGYWALARGHGYDQNLCHDNDRVFLTWHRAYVYSFEKALNTALQWKRNDQQLELTLPFWDWTRTDPATDAANGIPRLFDDKTYTDAAGAQKPNPLRSARSMYRAVNQDLTGAAQLTERYPARFRQAIPQLADDVARYLSNPDFPTFSNDFDFGAHGTIHVTVGGANAASPLPGNGGDMSSIVSAAYDPIFWFHHAMVDKVWFDWQTANGDDSVPQDVREAVVFSGFTGSELLDAEHGLRYIYSAEPVSAAEDVAGTTDDAATGEEGVVAAAPPAPPAPGAPPPPPAPMYPTFPLGAVHGPFKRAQLDFHQLRPPKDSYEIRVFFNNPGATDATPASDPSYGGRMVLFGHGHCHGAKGHCNPKLARRDEYDLRAKHPLRFEHTKYTIDVTRGLRRVIQADPASVDVTFVTINLDGKGVAHETIRYRGVSLSTR